MAKVVAAACTATAQFVPAAAGPVAPNAAAGPMAAVGFAAFGGAAAIIAIAIYLVALMLQSRVEEGAPRSFLIPEIEWVGGDSDFGWPARAPSAFQLSTVADSEAEEGEPPQPTPAAGEETVRKYSPDLPAREGGGLRVF